MYLHNPYFTLLTKPNRTNVTSELPMKDITLGLKYINNWKYHYKAHFC